MIGSVNTGGGAKAFAFIVATYPEGSICTCTDGIKTLRAKNTSGSWVFDIPYAGTWTVHSDTDSKSVSIEQKGQSVNVYMPIYLFRDGTYDGEWSAFNWKDAGSSFYQMAPNINSISSVIDVTYKRYSSSHSSVGCIANNQLIHGGRYTRLLITYADKNPTGDLNSLIGRVVDRYSDGYALYADGENTHSMTAETFSVDISNVTNDFYVNISSWMSASLATMNVKITEVKLS